MRVVGANEPVFDFEATGALCGTAPFVHAFVRRSLRAVVETVGHTVIIGVCVRHAATAITGRSLLGIVRAAVVGVTHSVTVGVIGIIQWTGIRRVARPITVGVIRIVQRTGVVGITDAVAVRVVRVVIGARIIAIDYAVVVVILLLNLA